MSAFVGLEGKLILRNLKDFPVIFPNWNRQHSEFDTISQISEYAKWSVTNIENNELNLPKNHHLLLLHLLSRCMLGEAHETSGIP